MIASQESCPTSMPAPSGRPSRLPTMHVTTMAPGRPPRPPSVPNDIDLSSSTRHDRTPYVRDGQKKPTRAGTRERTHSSGSTDSTDGVVGAADVNENPNQTAQSMNLSRSYDAGRERTNHRKGNSRRTKKKAPSRDNQSEHVLMESRSLSRSFDTSNLPLTREERRHRSPSKSEKKSGHGRTSDQSKRSRKIATESSKLAQSPRKHALIDNDQVMRPTSCSKERKISISNTDGQYQIRRSLSAPNEAFRSLSTVGNRSVLKKTSFPHPYGINNTEERTAIAVKSTATLPSGSENANAPFEDAPSQKVESRDADAEGEEDCISINNKDKREGLGVDVGTDRYQTISEDSWVSEASEEMHTEGHKAQSGLGSHAKASVVSIQDHSRSSSRASEATARAGNTQEHRRMRYSVPEDLEDSDLMVFAMSPESSKTNTPWAQGDFMERSRNDECTFDPEGVLAEALQPKESAVDCDASVELKLVQDAVTIQSDVMKERQKYSQTNRVGNFLVRVSSDISSLSGNLEGMHFLDDNNSVAASERETGNSSFYHKNGTLDAFDVSSNMHCSSTHHAENAATHVPMSGGSYDWSIPATPSELLADKYDAAGEITQNTSNRAPFVYTEEVHQYRQKTIESARTDQIEEFSSEALITELENRIALQKATPKEKQKPNQKGRGQGTDAAYETAGEIRIGDDQGAFSVALSSLSSNRDFSSSGNMHSSRPRNVPHEEKTKQAVGSDLDGEGALLKNDPSLQLISKIQQSVQEPEVLQCDNVVPMVDVTSLETSTDEEVVEGAKSKDTVVQQDEEERKFWVAIAVLAASSVIDNGGNDEIAQDAADAVLSFCRESSEVNLQRLSLVASEASVAVLESGGSPRTAAAVAVAVLEMASCMRKNEASKDQGSFIKPPDAHGEPDAQTKQVKERTQQRAEEDTSCEEVTTSDTLTPNYHAEDGRLPTGQTDMKSSNNEEDGAVEDDCNKEASSELMNYAANESKNERIFGLNNASRSFKESTVKGQNVIVAGADEEFEVFFPSAQSTSETVTSEDTRGSKTRLKTFAKNMFKPPVEQAKTSQTSTTAKVKTVSRKADTTGNVNGVLRKESKLRTVFGCAFLCRKKHQEKEVDPCLLHGEHSLSPWTKLKKARNRKRRAPMRKLYEI